MPQPLNSANRLLPNGQVKPEQRSIMIRHLLLKDKTLVHPDESSFHRDKPYFQRLLLAGFQVGIENDADRTGIRSVVAV